MKNYSYLINKKSINIFLLFVVCVFIFLINKYDLNELKKNSVYIIKQNIKLVSFFSFLKINNSFDLSKTEKVEFEIDKVKYKIKKFKFKKLKDHGPRSYIRIHDNNLFLITGTGVLLTANIDEINSDLSQLEFKTIETNIDNYLAEYKKETDVFFTSTVKDVLVREDKIFISIIQKFRDKYNYNTKKKEECFKHAILKGDLSLNKINLNNFFIVDACRK